MDLMNLSDQVDKDFATARRRARIGALGSRFVGGHGSGTLLPFEETRRALGAVGGLRLGRRTVELSRVVGSIGQHDRLTRPSCPFAELPRKGGSGWTGPFGLASICSRSASTR